MSDVAAISRHRMGTDGEGVTTLVGFFDCPLNCKYCINRDCKDIRTARASYKPQELIDRLAIDAPYFLMSGGGITFGGGEPLLQAEFICEVCSLAPAQWKKNIETSLYHTWQSIRSLRNVIDCWFVDIKEVNAEVYRKYTGRSNEVVLENLKKLVDTVGTEKVLVRYPLIPSYNTETMRDAGIQILKETIHPSLKIEKFTYIKSEDPLRRPKSTSHWS